MQYLNEYDPTIEDYYDGISELDCYEVIIVYSRGTKLYFLLKLLSVVTFELYYICYSR